MEEKTPRQVNNWFLDKIFMILSLSETIESALKKKLYKCHLAAEKSLSEMLQIITVSSHSLKIAVITGVWEMLILQDFAWGNTKTFFKRLGEIG